MVKLLAIAALFAGAQATNEANPISGLTCNYVARDSGEDIRGWIETAPADYYAAGWGFSFATSDDGEQGALDTYINPDGWKLDSNCTIRTADDMGLIQRRDYCKKVCWLGGAFTRNEANLNKWEDALNNLESSSDCRTETCLNSMMDSVKDFVAGSGELTQGSTTRQVYEARSDGRPQKIIVKYDTRRRLSDLHRRLSEEDEDGFGLHWDDAAYRKGGNYWCIDNETTDVYCNSKGHLGVPPPNPASGLHRRLFQFTGKMTYGDRMGLEASANIKSGDYEADEETAISKCKKLEEQNNSSKTETGAHRTTDKFHCSAALKAICDPMKDRTCRVRTGCDNKGICSYEYTIEGDKRDISCSATGCWTA